MPDPSPKHRSQVPRPRDRRSAAAPASSDPPQVVDPVWLLKALGIAILAALICGYITVCLLFYQGQWQLVLHPSKATPAPETIAGTAYEAVRFGVDESGAPQLTGWWIPATLGGKYAAYTLLYLPSGDGSLAAAGGDLAALHTLGINIFAFDYRGYGQSAPKRPNQHRMTEDAASAWSYLTVSRAIPATKLVPFGVGVGGALAVQLGIEHPDTPAVLIDSPRPDLLQVVLADPRTEMVPVRALFHERFEIAAPLAALKTPKLLLLSSNSALLQGMVAAAAAPKMVANVPRAQHNSPLYLEQITRFLDEYLH